MFFVGEDLGVGPLSKEQGKCAEEDGLARSSFAGDDDKAFVEDNVGLANQRIVFNMEGLEHGN